MKKNKKSLHVDAEQAILMFQEGSPLIIVMMRIEKMKETLQFLLNIALLIWSILWLKKQEDLFVHH